MTFEGATPPAFGGRVFVNTPLLTTIYVPRGAKAAYLAVPQLNGFNIVGIGEVGTSSVPGDVTGTGIVTISDALEILMKLAGLESVAPDDVTINDALDILMHLAGMPSDMRIYGG
jgi:hypothetical protein